MSILNPSTFLDLVQRFAQEAQIAGQVTTIVGAEGQALDLAMWVNQGYLETCQEREDWGFLLVSPGVSFVTVAGQQIYTPTQAGVSAGEVSSWKIDTFRNYQTSTGYPSELRMTAIEYDAWVATERINVLRTTQVRPMTFAITPLDELALQCPAAGYTIIGDYYRSAQPMDDDADVPLIPTRYNMVIVYKALMEYATEEEDAAMFNRAERLYRYELSRLERKYLPRIASSGALA